jgi:hypothetical protein
MLFAFPAAMAIPIIAAILLGGPLAGFLIAAVVATVIVAIAIGLKPPGQHRASARAPRADDQGWRAAAARRFVLIGCAALVGELSANAPLIDRPAVRQRASGIP